MLDERHRGSLPLVVTSMDRLDIVLGLLSSQVSGIGIVHHVVPLRLPAAPFFTPSSS